MKSCISRNIPEGFSTGEGPQFYYITDRRRLTGISLESCIRRALKWGVDFIQIREKDLSDRILFEQIKRAVGLALGTRSRILVNGRADVALAAGAHGVHLPSAGLRACDIRPWLPDNFLIGISTHTEEELKRTCGGGYDYVLLGHIFPTSSKSGMGDPVGIEFLGKVCADFRVPIVALGGINAARVAPVLQTGAAGVAGIGLFQKKEEFDALRKLYPSRMHFRKNIITS